MLTDAEFSLLSREVKARSGAVLSREISGAVEMKLAPVARREGFTHISELIAAARVKTDGHLWTSIADAVALCETRFFRDRATFSKLREQIIPAVAERRAHERFRIWSAACATGQEAYSIAMMLDELRDEGLGAAAEIIGTDMSQRLIDKARAGLYTQFEVQRGLPIKKLIAHFERAGDLWRISDRMRAAVRFEPHNLLKHPGSLGRFDIILLCHVLGGFDPETRLSVLLRVADTMQAKGCIVLGAGETMPEGAEGFRCVDGIITREDGARRAA